MAKEKKSIWTHLVAAPMGVGFDADLARDYWFWEGEPWSATHEVRFRFAKLLYLYFASALVQIGIPAIIVLAVGAVFKGEFGAGHALPGYVFVFGGWITAIGLGFALIFACWEYWKIHKQVDHLRKP